MTDTLRDKIAQVIHDCDMQRDSFRDIAQAIIDALPSMVPELKWKNDLPSSHGFPDIAMLPDGSGYYQRWWVDGKEYFKHSTWTHGRQGNANTHHCAQIMQVMGEEYHG